MRPIRSSKPWILPLVVMLFFLSGSSQSPTVESPRAEQLRGLEVRMTALEEALASAPQGAFDAQPAADSVVRKFAEGK